MRILVLLTLLLSIGGCTQQLQQANDTLRDVNSVLATLNGNPQAQSGQQSTSAAPVFPQPTQLQASALQNQLNGASSDKQLIAARNEAAPTIEKVISFISCYPDWSPWRYLQPYLMPGTENSVLAPMNGMRYHAQEQCLKVARMDNWSMPARNALAFRTVYASDVSGESKSYNYEVVRQTDGAWLFKRAGF